jgi:hypothetical protein
VRLGCRVEAGYSTPKCCILSRLGAPDLFN